MRFERLACRRKTERENVADFVHQAVVEHPGAARVEPRVEQVAIGEESQFQGAISTEGIAAFAKKLADAPPCEEAYLQGAGNFGHIVGVNPGCGTRIESSKEAVNGSGPAGFAGSHRQAQLALKLQVAIRSPAQVTVFDDLGVYQLLADIGDIGSVEGFVRRWLGRLLEYDIARSTQLVETLSEYLECGGNYDATARQLSVHRSTLRYRLQRVRTVSGHDLADPDTRFNLQLATRAWTTVHAMAQA